MWENICHSLSLIQTLVFLLFVPAPRYTGLCRSKDDPSLFGKRPSVTRIPSTRRWKVLFSTLNWTCAHANKLSHPQNITSPSLWHDCDMTHRYEKIITAFFPLHIKSYVLIVYAEKKDQDSHYWCFKLLNSAFLTRRVICLVEIHALCKFYKFVHMKPDRNRNKFRFILKLCVK